MIENPKYEDYKDINFGYKVINQLVYHKGSRIPLCLLKYKRLELPTLPNVSILILDATTPKKLYEMFCKKMGRKLEVKERVEDFERNIYQISRPFYYKASLKIKKCWDRVMYILHKIIKKHRSSTIGIILPKEFKEKLFEQLKEWKVEENCLVEHYGNFLGLNKFQDVPVLIIIGTYEQNPEGLKEEVEIWYEGEKKINMEGVKTGYEGVLYKDERVMEFLRMKRENTIEQGIERQRFYISFKTKDGKDKVCYLLTAQPISFKTKIMTTGELIRMLEGKTPDEMDGRIIGVLKYNPIQSFEKLYQTVGGDRNRFSSRLRVLLENGVVKTEFVKKGGKGRPSILYKV